MLKFLDGWKTILGTTLAAIPLAYAAFEAQAWGELMVIVGGWLAAIGAAHKADKIAAAGKAAVPLLLAVLLMGGCATAAPQKQEVDAGTKQKAGEYTNEFVVNGWKSVGSVKDSARMGDQQTIVQKRTLVKVPVILANGSQAIGPDGKGVFTYITGSTGDVYVLMNGDIDAHNEVMASGTTTADAKSGDTGAEKRDTSSARGGGDGNSLDLRQPGSGGVSTGTGTDGE